MDNLHDEIAELKQFIAELKADRAATKEKEKREAWTKYVSLTVVIIAVFGSIAAQWAGKFGGRSAMSQAQASDQWALYQSKSIKQHMVEMLEKDSKDFPARMAKYDKDKAEAKDKAEGLEKTRDFNAKLSGITGIAISYFSIAIAMASICLMKKKKPLWFLSMLMGAWAVAKLVQVYCLIGHWP